MKRSMRRHREIRFVRNRLEAAKRRSVRLGAPGHRRGFHVHRLRPYAFASLAFCWPRYRWSKLTSTHARSRVDPASISWRR